MTRIELGDWTAWARSGPVPDSFSGEFAAHAPGSIHTDLMAAGLLADPLLKDEERRQHWIGLVDWSMSTQFVLDLPTSGVLCLDGVDTLAKVFVNDRLVAELSNMHRRYRISLSDLMEGVNTVRIDFDAPIPAADRLSLEQGMRAHINDHPYNAIRKMACSFGWDWGPDTSTSGLWRPAWVELGNLLRLEGLKISSSASNNDGVVKATLPDEVERWSIRVFGHGVDITASGDGATAELTVPDALLWWPSGAGEQHLYQVEVTAEQGGSRTTAHRQVGFRRVRWDQTSTDRGSDFRLFINDRAVWARGMNWIPDDPFPHRVSEQQLRQQLGNAVELGCNLIRVWGGGTWESDTFYDLCDELGLMIWQDATFACAFYDENEPMASEVELEVKDNLLRIGHHASLVLVNGGNECEVMGAGRGWQDARDPDMSWGLGYWRDLLPRIIADVTPQVEYIPNSPFSPDVHDDPNDQAQGTIHIWDLWNSRPYWDYLTYRPTFAAEFGWQAPPAWSTLRHAVGDQPMTPVSPQVLLHQKGGAGQLKIQRGIVLEFGVQPDMRRWHWAAQVVQARALETAIDWFRSLPECGGAIIWQLNDCWPVISWSVVDSLGWRKPAFHVLQRAYAPRTATIHKSDGARLHLSNHGQEPWAARGRLTAYGVDGDERAAQEFHVDVARGESVNVRLDAQLAESREGEFIRIDVDGAPRRHWWQMGPAAPRLQQGQLEVSVEGDDVVVNATGVVRDVWLAVDELFDDLTGAATAVNRAVVGEQMVTLLPGETHRWHLAELVGLDDIDRVRSAVKDANMLDDKDWMRA